MPRRLGLILVAIVALTVAAVPSFAASSSTLAYHASWKSGWVVYDVTKSGGSASDQMIVTQTCWSNGQVVYQDFKGVFWSSRKAGDTTFPVSGDTCAASLSTYGVSTSRAVAQVTFSTAGMLG